MHSRVIIGLLLCLASLVLGCIELKSVKREECPHWSYDEEEGNGPLEWGSLCEAYIDCKAGVQQSPVHLYSNNIQTAKEKSTDLVPKYQEEHSVEFQNNGHTVMVSNTDENNTLTLPDGTVYILSQFHFHDTSEHTLDDKYYPLEMHLAHSHSNGAISDTAVLGFFFEEGPESELLAELIDASSQVKNPSNSTTIPLLKLQTLINQSFEFWYYEGSLTTPPCTENVKWFISQTILTASNDQISTIAELMGRNHRPPQPMYHRELTSYRLNGSSTLELMVTLFLGCLLVSIIF